MLSARCVSVLMTSILCSMGWWLCNCMCMCRLSVHTGLEWPISGGQGVEQGEFNICLHFADPLDAGVLSVQMMCERLDVCCFDHCRGIINVPAPIFDWVQVCFQRFTIIILHTQIGHNGANRCANSRAFYLSVDITIIFEICGGQALAQSVRHLLGAKGGPVCQRGISCQLLVYQCEALFCWDAVYIIWPIKIGNI